MSQSCPHRRDRDHMLSVSQAICYLHGIQMLRVCIHQRTSFNLLQKQSGSNSMVESQPSKLLVASSILVSRSKKLTAPETRSTPPRCQLPFVQVFSPTA